MNMRFGLLCIALLPSVLFCQPANKTPAKEKPDNSGFLISPTVFKDDGCAGDFIKAQALSGVGKRKALAEIAEYGCVEERMGAVYRATVVASSMVASKTGNVKISKVLLVMDADRTAAAVSAQDPTGGTKPDYENIISRTVGWIIDSDLHRISGPAVDKLLWDLTLKRLQQLNH